LATSGGSALTGRKQAEPQPLPTDPTEVDIDAMGIRLLRYVRNRISVLGWRDADPVLAEGTGAQDIAADAMASLFSGTRQWKPKNEPDPWRHVSSVANSMISNLLQSADVRKTARGVEDDCAADHVTPESILLENERQRWSERADNLLLERIIDDEDLTKMYELAETEDIERPAEVAARLGWPRERVYRANERLQRHRDAVIAVLRKAREEGEDGCA
jgi:hypothetical protein